MTSCFFFPAQQIPSEKWTAPKGKNLLAREANFFPFRIDPFQKECKTIKNCLP